MFVAPLLATRNELIGWVAPAGSRTEAYTWPVTAFVGGIAIGSALAGTLVEEASWRTAFVVAGRDRRRRHGPGGRAPADRGSAAVVCRRADRPGERELIVQRIRALAFPSTSTSTLRGRLVERPALVGERRPQHAALGTLAVDERAR